jgi:putative flippase GtrA
VPYVLIGGIALVVELATFYALTDVAGVHLALGNFTAMLLGMLTSFGLNSRYNFQVTDRLLVRFASFAAITGLSYLFSTFMLIVMVEWAGLTAFVAKLLTLPAMLVIQFTLNKRLTFAQTRPKPEPETER